MSARPPDAPLIPADPLGADRTAFEASSPPRGAAHEPLAAFPAVEAATSSGGGSRGHGPIEQPGLAPMATIAAARQ